MQKILIIGGGFAGISAAYRLCRSGIQSEVTLIDKKETSDFLPMLPDCIGRGINPEYLSYKIEVIAKKNKFKFIYAQVNRINLETKEIFTPDQSFNYNYLIISSGSETNFYGNESIENNAYKLNGIEDAQALTAVLKEKDFENYVISGGGYTGIEVATNLRVFLGQAKKNKRIIIVERASAILGPLPEWMKKYVVDNLRRLNIDIFVNSAIEKIEGGRVYLSEGRILDGSTSLTINPEPAPVFGPESRRIDNTMVIWAAGVKTAKFIQDLNVEKNPQGRIKVDEFLRLNDACFVIGDAANFSHEKNFLRMAVQFAIFEGESAALNIIRSIKGLPLQEYQPVDLGYIIPMANNRSCGRVFGVKFKGIIPTIFHFIMCIYRCYGMKNKLGIVKGLIAGGQMKPRFTER